MSEKIIEYGNLRRIVHKLVCDDCSVEMRNTNRCYTINPPIYEYYCPTCGKLTTTRQIYPWFDLVGDIINEQ